MKFINAGLFWSWTSLKYLEAKRSAISISYGLAPSCLDYKYKASAWQSKNCLGFLNAPLNFDETVPKTLKSFTKRDNGYMNIYLFSESWNVYNILIID